MRQAASARQIIIYMLTGRRPCGALEPGRFLAKRGRKSGRSSDAEEVPMRKIRCEARMRRFRTRRRAGHPVYFLFAPEWRNGRRGGLKNRCPRRAGSNPASGTIRKQFELAEEIFALASSSLFSENSSSPLLEVSYSICGWNISERPHQPYHPAAIYAVTGSSKSFTAASLKVNLRGRFETTETRPLSSRSFRYFRAVCTLTSACTATSCKGISGKAPNK